MVIFQTPDGSPGYKQFGSLDESVAFVEELRNDRGITNARMFALEEIKFEMKPVFRVELQALNAGPEPEAAAPAAAAPQVPTPPQQPQAPAPSEPAGQPASAQAAPPVQPSEPQGDSSEEQPARRGLFGR